MHVRVPLRTGAPIMAALICLAFAGACSSSSSGGGATGGTGGSIGANGGSGGALGGTVARGQYLVDHLLVCGECHTPSGADGKPDSGKYLAGSRSYDFQYMGKIVSVYAENLTSHATEGLGMWTDANVRKAL